MDEHVKNKRKKKKKNNFLRQSKHYAKKGTYGKGKTLSDSQYNYYINVFELMKQVKGDEKEMLVQNFLTGVIEDDEVKKLACNQIVSRILDDALPLAEVPQILSLSQIFAEDIRTTCLDPYASHVLQTLMSLAFKYTQKQKAEETNVEQEKKAVEEPVITATEEEKEEFSSFLNKVGRFIHNNLDEFIRDMYGSHVLRSVLETCSGVEVESSIKSSQKSQSKHSLCHDTSQIVKIPMELQTLLNEIAERLLMLPEFPVIITKGSSSASLQAALLVLKGSENKRCSPLIEHILTNGFAHIGLWYCEDHDESYNVPALFHSSPAVRLLEVVLACATDEQLSNIFNAYFKGNMSELVRHPVGNFAVQKLLLCWRQKDTFHELFEEVQVALPVALELKHTGVIHALALACQKLGKSQGQCWKVITQLLKCYEPQERQLSVAPCLLRFLNYDDYQQKHAAGELPSLSLHGSLILQEFLRYIRTIKIVDSIMAMDFADLHFMAGDPRGSHVIDAFFSSPFIKLNNKERFISSFKGTYVTLACSRHGSRSLEAMWGVASVKFKTGICEELAKEELKLKGNQHGTIIFNKFMVRLFNKKDKQDWQELVDSAAKKKRLLDDLLTDVVGEKPKKKKKKKEKEEVKEEDW